MNITKIIDSIISVIMGVQKFQDEAIRKMTATAEMIQRRMMRRLYQSIFYCSGALILTAGIIIFLTRYFPLDIILIVVGLMLLYVGLVVGYKPYNRRRPM